MNTLPLWAQLTITLLTVTNISGLVVFVLTYRQKNQELKEARLQWLNNTVVQNTRPHIDPLYIPINKILAKLELRYNDYKVARGRCHGYEYKKSHRAEDNPESQASIELGLLLYGEKHDTTISFVSAAAEIMACLEKMTDEGTVAYLTPQFKKQVETFSWFLYGVMAVANTYMLSYRDPGDEQPKRLILGTPEFEDEFYASIDSIRAYINGLALGTTDLIKPPFDKNSAR